MPLMLVKRVQVKWISPFLLEVWSIFCTLMGMFHSGEGVFSDELPVDAEDVYTTVNQGAEVI